MLPNDSVATRLFSRGDFLVSKSPAYAVTREPKNSSPNFDQQATSVLDHAEACAEACLPCGLDVGSRGDIPNLFNTRRDRVGDHLACQDPFAMCYGGHQFGNWAGQLGDGRAINLGDVVSQDDQRWTLQLKGAGPAPYSRHADGIAVLRSSVREFLCSEAIQHLGVPTTRALSLVLTGEQVVRDMFYDGNPESEPGAVVCRVVRSLWQL